MASWPAAALTKRRRSGRWARLALLSVRIVSIVGHIHAALCVLSDCDPTFLEELICLSNALSTQKISCKFASLNAMACISCVA